MHCAAQVEHAQNLCNRDKEADAVLSEGRDVYKRQGLRKHDAIPYRSMGPVTEEEYLSRQERYDKQLVERAGFCLLYTSRCV